MNIQDTILNIQDTINCIFKIVSSGAYLEGGRTGAPPLNSAKLLPPECQILRLKCTKFNFGWGSAPDPAGKAYSAPPDPLAGLRGPTSKGREGRRG